MKTKWMLIAVIIWGIISGCSPSNITPTSAMCHNYPIINASQPDCISLANGTLIQTALNQQTQLTVGQFELTIKGTIYIDINTTVMVLEGTTIIGIDDKIITLQTGDQVTLDNSAIGVITDYTFDTVANLPLEQLQRSVTIPQPTATIVITATERPACPRPDNWTQPYEVQPGDNLTGISQRANVTLEELESANCLNNPNSLPIGMTLYLPQGAIEPTHPATTYTPSAVFFRADSESINIGSCTTLRWDVQNIREIKLDGNLITTETSRQICPDQTTTYTLTVTYYDDTQSEHHVTITTTP